MGSRQGMFRFRKHSGEIKAIIAQQHSKYCSDSLKDFSVCGLALTMREGMKK